MPHKLYDVCPYCLEEVGRIGDIDYCASCELIVEGSTLQLTEDQIEWGYELDSETEA